jgi:RHS repeat-associated protein
VVINYVNGKVNTIADPSGNVHTFAYSGQNLTGVSSQIVGVGTSNWSYTYYDNSFMHTKTDPLNKTTTYYYDSDHRLVQSTDPEGKNRSFAYAPAQSFTRMTEKDGGIWKFTYNPELGVLTEKEDPYGKKEKFGYNTGKLEYIEDQRGKRTYFAYDSGGNGNITSITDALSQVTNYPMYNSLNQVKRIEYPGSPTPVVLLDYNAQGNLTYFKDPGGNETQFGYDSRGNRTTIQSIGNNLVNVTNTYDQYNYLRTITDNRTGAQVQLEYDSAGNLSVHKDPMTPTNNTTYEYNGFSKVKKVTDPEGNIINFYYDLMANLASMTDANSKTTSYEYNYRGQATKITDALNNITQFAYGSGCPSCGTGVEKLTSVTDGRGKTTIFEYDLTGRIIKETDALGKYKTYAYDVLLNKITKTDEDGVAIHYTYDDLYRLTQISYPSSLTATFGYDARGNMNAAANPNIGYTFTYDLNNLLSSVLDSNNKTITYQYNSLNQRTRMVADGRTIDYTYDNGNRLWQVLSPIPVAEILYDAAGRRQTLSYPNLVTTTYSYNKSSFLTNLLARYNQQTTINSFAYTPDGMGNRINMTDLAGVHNYTYDNTYQLTQATHPNMPLEQFTYDQVGNRLSSEGQAPGSGMITEYVYDFENRLIEVNYTGMLAQYKYDPFGRRIEKNMNGTITRYVYDGPHIVSEYDGSWNVKAQYVSTLDIDDPVTVTQGGNTYYYHKDGLGSVVNLTNIAGTVLKSYTYKSFGEIHSETGSLVQPFAFTGREYDSESGLYFYRARSYDPRAGKFVTKDPIGFMGGDVNLYRGMGNDPVNWIDPFGLEMVSLQSGMGIVKKAKGWIGVPYQTGGSSRKGIDCSNLVCIVYREAGLNYPYTPSAKFGSAECFEKIKTTPQEGDVILFYGHMGIFTEGKVISAQSGEGKVTLGEIKWFGPVKGYYRYKK